MVPEGSLSFSQELAIGSYSGRRRRRGNITVKREKVWFWKERPSLFLGTVPVFRKRLNKNCDKSESREALTRPGFERIIFIIQVLSVRGILTARYSGNWGIYFSTVFSVEFGGNPYQPRREEFFTTVWTDVRIYRAGIIDNQWFISIVELVVGAKYL